MIVKQNQISTPMGDGIQVVAVRDIYVGEEITVTYGSQYFGEDNCECLCASAIGRGATLDQDRLSKDGGLERSWRQDRPV